MLILEKFASQRPGFVGTLPDNLPIGASAGFMDRFPTSTLASRGNSAKFQVLTLGSQPNSALVPDSPGYYGQSLDPG